MGVSNDFAGVAVGVKIFPFSEGRKGDTSISEEVKRMALEGEHDESVLRS